MDDKTIMTIVFTSLVIFALLGLLGACKTKNWLALWGFVLLSGALWGWVDLWVSLL